MACVLRQGHTVVLPPAAAHRQCKLPVRSDGERDSKSSRRFTYFIVVNEYDSLVRDTWFQAFVEANEKRARLIESAGVSC